MQKLQQFPIRTFLCVPIVYGKNVTHKLLHMHADSHSVVWCVCVEFIALIDICICELFGSCGCNICNHDMLH